MLNSLYLYTNYYTLIFEIYAYNIFETNWYNYKYNTEQFRLE